MATQKTTRTTTVVSEVPDERRWQGRDWAKTAIAGALALALLRPGAQPVAQVQPTAVAQPTAAATAAPTVAATVGLPGAAAPVVLSTREAVTAGPYEIRGTGSPGSLVEVLINGVSAGTATVGDDGSWSLPTTLEAGDVEIFAQAVNEGSTVIAAGEPVQLAVGAAAGATSGPIGLPAIFPPVIETSLDGLAAGPVTFEGTATPGTTVELLVNGEPAGTAAVGDDGRWSIDAVLAAGTNELQPRALDEAGALLAEDEPISVEVGGGAGETAGGDLVAPALNLPAGDLPGGPVSLSGTGAPGSTVRVTVGGVDAGIATVGDDGTWTLDAILPAGQQELVVEAIDAAGAVLAASEPVTVNVVGGLGVTLAEPAEGAELPAGPTRVSGTGAPGTVLEILNGDQVLGEVTVGADGSWSTEVPLADGTAAISVRERGTDQVLNRPVRVQVGTGEAPAAQACTEIAVGCDAWVTRAGGLTLRMRSAPTIQPDNIIARLPIGTQMRVEEGPQSADGFTWWRVITTGGNEGWVAGENLVLQPD
jgi:large repetitive protein